MWETAVPVCDDDQRRMFEAAALPHLGEIHRIARRVIGQSCWAEDVTQEVFLQAWRSFHRFEPGTNCRAWLLAILFHMCQQHRREMRRWQTVRWGPEHDRMVTVPAMRPAGGMDPALLRALDALPETSKAVLILAEVYEYSYREIASILRVPIGTVMSRLNRGRKRAREVLLACRAAEARAA